MSAWCDFFVPCRLKGMPSARGEDGEAGEADGDFLLFGVGREDLDGEWDRERRSCLMEEKPSMR